MADFGELLVLWRTLHSETGAGHLNSKDFGELYVLAFLLAFALRFKKAAVTPKSKHYEKYFGELLGRTLDSDLTVLSAVGTVFAKLPYVCFFSAGSCHQHVSKANSCIIKQQ